MACGAQMKYYYPIKKIIMSSSGVWTLEDDDDDELVDDSLSLDEVAERIASKIQEQRKQLKWRKKLPFSVEQQRAWRKSLKKGVKP